ncbi:MAG TPA: protein translocase subunit SecD [Candidatus Kryptobacter bacterium]|nr:MAG: protein translocase subunit SecD [Ignavibacteriae bacterium 37-53-5]HQT90931.1 protein translocase subunit SecD [Candidatus Kryptobacter bacterium]
MRKNRFRIILIIAAIALASYYLYPTYESSTYDKHLTELSGQAKLETYLQSHSLPQMPDSLKNGYIDSLSQAFSADSLKYYDANAKAITDARLKRIKLGLDLQGGMHIVLQVNVVKMLDDMAKNKDQTFNDIMKQVAAQVKQTDANPLTVLEQEFTQRGIRLSRYYGDIRDDNSKVMSYLSDQTKTAVDRAMEIVRNRVDQYGVSEPSIQKQGSTRFIVELPGVSNETEVRELLQGTALLEFKLLKPEDVVVKVFQAIDNVMAGKPDSLSQADTTSSSDSTMTAAEFARKHPLFAIVRVNAQTGDAYVAETDKDQFMRIINSPDVKRVIPSDFEFLFSAKPQVTAQAQKYYGLYVVNKTAELTGSVVTDAQAQIDPTTNTPIVTMKMNSAGSRDWGRITGANIGKRVAIVLDNAVYSAPVVRSKITGGSSQIEGMANMDEANLLAIVLRAGALPAPVDIVEERNVGPSLGEDSIRSGVTSGLIGLALIVLFMGFYYHLGGVMADFALLINIFFILGVLAAFHGTLTMPGIAGMILTIAVAVDANVLIYERIREEMTTGKTLRASIDQGYSKAFTAIFDANIISLFTGAILYQFGTGPVQGFALTLMIGIVASLFSAIVITRVIFDIMIERGATTINFG